MLKYHTFELSKEHLKVIEEDTRSQAAGSQFFHHRAGRIGASVSKQASHKDPAQPSTSLIKTICYPSIFKFSTTATECGCKHERLALKANENIMKQNHVNFKIEKCGTFVSAEYPWIHSPAIAVLKGVGKSKVSLLPQGC